MEEDKSLMETNHGLSSEMLNRMRAAVLGANDGIVSTSAVVMGVAGATDNTGAIFTAGLAALVAGALSMAVGEYVSVSSQSDAEKMYIEKEKIELRDRPEKELKQLTDEYEAIGLSRKTAQHVARELTDNDALAAHLRMHFQIVDEEVVSPISAALASLMAFTVGGLVPFLTIMLTPVHQRIWWTVGAVLIALFATGYLSATAGGASRRRAVIRVVIGGVLAMAITYFVGVLFGTSVG